MIFRRGSAIRPFTFSHPPFGEPVADPFAFAAAVLCREPYNGMTWPRLADAIENHAQSRPRLPRFRLRDR